MPLFHRSEPAPPPVEETRRSSRSGMFSRSRTPPPTTHHNAPAKQHGLFSRNRRHSASSSSISSASSRETGVTSRTSTSGRRGFLRRGDREDPSIIAAREQVVAAEAAETEADRALGAARQAVKDARDHVKRLELEAAEEARLAKIKQDQAAAIGKRGKALGRHDLHNF